MAKHPAESERPTFDVLVAEPEMVRPESVVVPNPRFETLRNGVVPTRNSPETNEVVDVAFVLVAFPMMLRLPLMVELAALMIRPPVVMRIEEVADCPALGWVKASYEARPLPVSSVPSQSPAPPVIEVQNPLHEEAMTPPKERPPEIERLVVVALVLVALVKIPVLGVDAPMGVLLMVPPSMVSAFVTWESVAEPMRSAKAMPRELVASCWYEEPAYEPSSIPAAVGFAIPVPPPPAVKSPAMELVKVMVLPLPVMVVEAVNPLNADEEVAKVSAPVKEP